MPLWVGPVWVCVCGFANAVLRTSCRNCNRFRVISEQDGQGLCRCPPGICILHPLRADCSMRGKAVSGD